MPEEFESSVILEGYQTGDANVSWVQEFESSVILEGYQTLVSGRV